METEHVCDKQPTRNWIGDQHMVWPMTMSVLGTREQLLHKGDTMSTAAPCLCKLLWHCKSPRLEASTPTVPCEHSCLVSQWLAVPIHCIFYKVKSPPARGKSRSSPSAQQGWGIQEKWSLHITLIQTSSRQKTKPQFQTLAWGQSSNLTFKHKCKKETKKPPKSYEQKSVPKYLQNTICNILFLKVVLHHLNSKWSKKLSDIILHRCTHSKSSL